MKYLRKYFGWINDDINNFSKKKLNEYDWKNPITWVRMLIVLILIFFSVITGLFLTSFVASIGALISGIVMTGILLFIIIIQVLKYFGIIKK